ncbi:MAG: hypothetical protein PHP59_09245 [Methanofollis sp.]|uniref:hypothetical protein n=1 Tax=Methanofollis sp. TaxID=2052835 RepID=UPI002610CE8B|nr:hypothetical protein [Methanofollis sp.]MDD4255545.1 hypothetical protein [Methanofollis sp.]
MPAKKTLTLGITVNLDNYENLRLEVSGEVGSQEDADDLASFLDTTLARLGRGDEATAERVDAYRRRVFSMKPVEAPLPPQPEEGGQTVLVPIEAEEAEAPEAVPEPAPGAAPEPAPAPQPVAAPEPEPTAAPAPKPEQPQAPTAAAACEECGEPVTKTQKQMSNLFLNKTLCKACMDRLTHHQ